MHDISHQNPRLEAFLRTTVEAVGRQAYELGFADGFLAGRLVGYVEGVNALTPAVSDGLRHGSPICARTLPALKRMSAITDQDDEESNDIDYSDHCNDEQTTWKTELLPSNHPQR